MMVFIGILVIVADIPICVSERIALGIGLSVRPWEHWAVSE